MKQLLCVACLIFASIQLASAEEFNRTRLDQTFRAQDSSLPSGLVTFAGHLVFKSNFYNEIDDELRPGIVARSENGKQFIVQLSETNSHPYPLVVDEHLWFGDGPKLWRLTNNLELQLDFEGTNENATLGRKVQFGDGIVFALHFQDRPTSSVFYLKDGLAKELASFAQPPRPNDNLLIDAIEINGNLFFTAFDLQKGVMLINLDPKGNVTVFPDLDDGKTLSGPSELVEFQGSLYFLSPDIEGNRSVFFLDQDMTARSLEILPNANPGGLRNLGESLIFTAHHPETGFGIYKLNGLYPESPALLANGVSGLTFEIEGQWYISAVSDMSEDVVWRLTPNSNLEKVNWQGPSPVGQSPDEYIWFDNRLFYIGYTAETKAEIWYVDRKFEPVLINEINTVSTDWLDGNADADGFTIFGEQLYFFANDGRNGRSLWQISRSQ